MIYLDDVIQDIGAEARRDAGGGAEGGRGVYLQQPGLNTQHMTRIIFYRGKFSVYIL